MSDKDTPHEDSKAAPTEGSSEEAQSEIGAESSLLSADETNSLGEQTDEGSGEEPHETAHDSQEETPAEIPVESDEEDLVSEEILLGKAHLPEVKPVATSVQRRSKLRPVQIITGLCVLSLVAVIGVLGDGVSVATSNLMEEGTTVSVAAASADIVCPTPVSQEEEETNQPQPGNDADGDEETDAETDTDPDAEASVDDFEADQRVTQNSIQTSLIGTEGSVSFADLGIPVDVQTKADESAEDSNQQNPPSLGSVNARTPSAQKLISGYNSGLVVSTQNRAIADAELGQFTSATQASVTAGGDTRGIAATTCGTAQTEHWLVGGGTSLGTSSNLVVQNPSRTTASVTVTVWGPSGRVPLAGLETLLVPAGKQVSVFLEGIAVEQRRTAVHVQSTGTLVSSYLRVNSLDGITPLGIDYVTGGNGPSHTQVMTGLVVQDTETEGQATPLVRIVAPDFAEVIDLSEDLDDDEEPLSQDPVGAASITLLGAQGRFVLFGADKIDLIAGAVVDLDLTGVPAGNYSVLVNADIPVLAAVRAVAAGEEDPDNLVFGTPQDFGWIESSAVLISVDSEEDSFEDDSEAQSEDEATVQVESNSVTGTVSLIPGLESQLVISALPNVQTVEELNSALEMVPRFYASDADAGTEQETVEEQALRDAWKKTEKAAITTFTKTGAVLIQREVSLAIGQTLGLTLGELGGGSAHSILVESGPESVVDWAVVTTTADIEGAVSVLHPVTTAEESTEVRVTRSLSVGIN